MSGNTVSSADFAGKPLLVMFICRYCPYVKHVQDELAKIGKDYAGKIGIVAISSNDRAAIDALLSSQPISTDQKPSVGCSIKWTN